MNKKVLTLAGLIVFFLSSCVREVVTPGPPAPRDPYQEVSMNYDWYSDAFETTYDIEFWNTGNLFVEEVEVRYEIYDDWGSLVEYGWRTFFVDLHPGQSTYQWFVIPEGYINQAHLEINYMYKKK